MEALSEPCPELLDRVEVKGQCRHEPCSDAFSNHSTCTHFGMKEGLWLLLEVQLGLLFSPAPHLKMFWSRNVLAISIVMKHHEGLSSMRLSEGSPFRDHLGPMNMPATASFNLPQPTTIHVGQLSPPQALRVLVLLVPLVALELLFRICHTGLGGGSAPHVALPMLVGTISWVTRGQQERCHP